MSLLIVAKPESGKSSAMKQYRENKGIVYLTDCTAYGLTRDVLPKIVTGEIKTIMIPDLLTPLSKQTKTRQLCCFPKQFDRRRHSQDHNIQHDME